MHPNFDQERVRLSSNHRVGLIVVGVLQYVVAASAIGCSIATIIFTMDCYYCNDSNFDYYQYNRQYFRFSVTAQGIWTGCMVFISASLNIRFAVKSTKQTGSFSAGFSLFSFLLTVVMIIMESSAISDSLIYYSYDVYNNDGYYYDLSFLTWALHCGLLAEAVCLFILTMTTMIISYVATGCYGCCCYKKPSSETAIGLHDATTYGRPQTVTDQVRFTSEGRSIGLGMEGTPSGNYHDLRLNPLPPIDTRLVFGKERSLVGSQTNGPAELDPYHQAMMGQSGTLVLPDMRQGYQTNSTIPTAHLDAPAQQNIAGMVGARVQEDQHNETTTSILDKPLTDASQQKAGQADDKTESVSNSTPENSRARL